MSNVVITGAQWGDEGKGRSLTSSPKRLIISSAIRAVIMRAIRSSSGIQSLSSI